MPRLWRRRNHLLDAPCASRPSRLATLPAFSSRGEKLRMICISWQHKALVPAHSKHPCGVLTVRECFDKVNDNFYLCLCVAIQQDDRLLQCPRRLLSCGRPPFTFFVFGCSCRADRERAASSCSATN
jgi:hypothetical protein